VIELGCDVADVLFRDLRPRVSKRIVPYLVSKRLFRINWRQKLVRGRLCRQRLD